MTEDYNKLINNENDLRVWCFETLKYRPEPLHYEKLCEGVHVDSKVRREVLIGRNQGKIVLEGKVKEIEFERLGGGVYKAYVSFLSEKDKS